MDFKFTIDGDLSEIMKRETLIGKRAVKAAMVQASGLLKQGFRNQVEAAGLGSRLAKSVRSESYPKGSVSLNASAMVWSKAPEIMYAFEKGVVIRREKGAWLAIPTPAAGRGTGGSRLTPLEWERRRGIPLRFVFRPGRTSLLVADGRLNSKGLGVRSGSKTGRGRATVVIFILVPQVRLRKRLNIAELGQSIAGQLPAMVVANWRDE